MKIHEDGIIFHRQRDLLIWRWPWKRIGSERIHSALLNADFPSMSEYWKRIGAFETKVLKSTGKLASYSMPEMLGLWSRTLHPGKDIVVLFDIDASAKNFSFWSRLPQAKVEHLLNDIVVLFCSDKSEAMQIISSISPEFAKAIAFSDGSLIDSNEWREDAGEVEA